MIISWGLLPQPDMTKTLPKLLRKAPIIEAVAEVRFSSSNGNLASTVLPGLLFNDLKEQYPAIQAHPSAQIPSEVKDQNPELRYLPSVVMVGENSSLNVGRAVLGIVINKPYPGWDSFKASILNVWQVAQKSGLIGSIERFSLKYVNLIDAPMDSNQLDCTTVKLTLGEHVVTSEPTTVRSELRKGRFITVASIVTQAQSLGANAATGLIVDLDVICNGPFVDSWDEIRTLLEDAHIIEKEVFFNLLTDHTIDRYEPEY